MTHQHNPTTVQDLIDELRQYDPSMPVMIDGYEGGLNDVDLSRVNCQDVELDGNGSYMSGQHETVIRRKDGSFFSSREEGPGEVVTVVLIRR